MNTSEKTLEFDKITEQLKAYASSSLGLEAVSNIEIANDFHSIVTALNETDEALKLIYRFGDLPFGGITDIRAFVKRAQISGVLSAADLVAIADFIYGVYQIKGYLEKIEEQKENVTYIKQYILNLIHLSALRREIEGCIDIHGNISDDASPKLKEIRNEIKAMEQRIKDKMAGILNSQKDYLTDNIITMRNDRYVVPVRVEYKNTFGGIIHDTSQSGSTVYIEPRAVVEMNNKVNLLMHDELEEVNRILRRLTALVAEDGEELLENCENIKVLDFIFAKARFAREMNAVKPLINDRGLIKILKGRHPLINKDEVIPNDIYLGDEFTAMIITGPNTGGKTVTLKTVGLFTLMMQAGLLVPANEQTELAVFDNIFADIGDEQSIEQSLSTFSSHLKNIIHIVNNVTINSLVLFDELGAGTDPKEGAALSMSLLDYFFERGSRIIATTHYSELKTYAYNHPKARNASVEFNIETLKPTFKLLIGIPGRSNALDISQRLGLKEKIVNAARNKLETERTDVANLIIQLENQGLYLDKLINENESLKAGLEKEKANFAKRNETLESERDALLLKARKEAVDLIQRAQKEADEVISELKELKKNKAADYKPHELSDIKTKLSTEKYYQEKVKESTTYQVLKPGDLVRVLTLGRTGELVEKVNDAEWLVQIGILTSRINEKSLELVEPEKSTYKKANTAENKVSVVKTSRQSFELDLRGERYEEALIRLDKFIDTALLNNFHQVTIIHGHGTGAIRKAVHSYLKTNSSVKEYRYGGEGEGGVGVTVVTFK